MEWIKKLRLETWETEKNRNPTAFIEFINFERNIIYIFCMPMADLFSRWILSVSRRIKNHFPLFCIGVKGKKKCVEVSPLTEVFFLLTCLHSQLSLGCEQTRIIGRFNIELTKHYPWIIFISLHDWIGSFFIFNFTFWLNQSGEREK